MLASSLIAAHTQEESPPPRVFDPARILDEENVSRPEDVVRALCDLYLPGGMKSAARAKLVAFVEEGAPEGDALKLAPDWVCEVVSPRTGRLDRTRKLRGRALRRRRDRALAVADRGDGPRDALNPGAS